MILIRQEASAIEPQPVRSCEQLPRAAPTCTNKLEPPWSNPTYSQLVPNSSDIGSHCSAGYPLAKMPAESEFGASCDGYS